jgi:hypothetical protein
MRTRERGELRRLLPLALVLALVSFSFFSIAGLADRRADKRPSIALLGSGDRPSVLISSGGARILVAQGDDSASFGNAFRQTGRFGDRSVDVLILIGDSGESTFLSRVVDAVNARHVELVGSPNLLGLLDLPTDTSVVSSRRYRIGDDVAITLESSDPSEWRAIAELRGATIAIYPDARAMESLPAPRGTDALVVGGEHPETALSSQPSAQLIIYGEATIDGRTARNAIAEVTETPVYTLRVENGQASEIEVVSGGLSLPGEAVPVNPRVEPES